MSILRPIQYPVLYVYFDNNYAILRFLSTPTTTKKTNLVRCNLSRFRLYQTIRFLLFMCNWFCHEHSHTVTHSPAAYKHTLRRFITAITRNCSMARPNHFTILHGSASALLALSTARSSACMPIIKTVSIKFYVITHNSHHLQLLCLAISSILIAPRFHFTS